MSIHTNSVLRLVKALRVMTKFTLTSEKIKLYHISSVISRVFFSFQYNPKNLDSSYKMDLDLWDCLGTVELVL